MICGELDKSRGYGLGGGGSQVKRESEISFDSHDIFNGHLLHQTGPGPSGTPEGTLELSSPLSWRDCRWGTRY